MPEETFADRLKELIGDRPANRFARDVEIGESLLRKYLAGAVPGIDKVAQISQATGASVEWLVTGNRAGVTAATDSQVHDIELSGPNGEVTYIEVKAARSPEFALIPRLDVQASAGAGLVSYNEDPLEYLAFQSNWLRGKGINPASARILSARGDSMEETIRDGDVLLVDTSINRVKDNAIYVVTYGDMVLVKRIHGRLNGSLQLISDNPKYPAEEVSSGEVSMLNIAGRVMWFGRSI